jgi:flagellar protein FlgJ
MEPEKFINMIGNTCRDICLKYNLPASVCIAQAALESGWGESVIGNYNYFGRKWNGWGNYVKLQTTEWTGNEYETVYAKFQSYNTLEQAIEDWCQLMRHEPAYENAMAVWDSTWNLTEFVNTMAPVYATDPSYAGKILSTIEANDLTRYDHNE